MPKKRNRPKSSKVQSKRSLNADQHEWMKQEGLKQEVVTLHAPFFIVQPNVGGAQMYTNTMYANANGFGTYNSAGSLLVDQMPQRGIWDTYAKMYRYYMIEHITVDFAPCRQQINVDSSSTLVSQWQMPSFINTFPKFTELVPTNTLTAANGAVQYLSARHKPRMVTAYEPMKFGFDIENNLLTRQAAPMLLTNGGVAARELYSPGFLSTITAVLTMAASNSPMGTALVSVRTRFAGLHRPDVSSIRDQTLLSKSPTDDEEMKEDPERDVGHSPSPSTTIVLPPVAPQEITGQTITDLQRQIARLQSVRDDRISHT